KLVTGVQTCALPISSQNPLLLQVSRHGSYRCVETCFPVEVRLPIRGQHAVIPDPVAARIKTIFVRVRREACPLTGGQQATELDTRSVEQQRMPEVTAILSLCAAGASESVLFHIGKSMRRFMK